MFLGLSHQNSLWFFSPARKEESLQSNVSILVVSSAVIIIKEFSPSISLTSPHLVSLSSNRKIFLDKNSDEAYAFSLWLHRNKSLSFIVKGSPFCLHQKVVSPLPILPCFLPCPTFLDFQKLLILFNFQFKENNKQLVLDTSISDSGFYQCIAENPYGSETATARIQITLGSEYKK